MFLMLLVLVLTSAPTWGLAGGARHPTSRSRLRTAPVAAGRETRPGVPGARLAVRLGLGFRGLNDLPPAFPACRATWRSIGPIGLTLATAFLGALIGVTIDLGLLDLERPTIVTWVLLFALATILAIGISWSHVRRRASG